MIGRELISQGQLRLKGTSVHKVPCVLSIHTILLFYSVIMGIATCESRHPTLPPLPFLPFSLFPFPLSLIPFSPFSSFFPFVPPSFSFFLCLSLLAFSCLFASLLFSPLRLIHVALRITISDDFQARAVVHLHGLDPCGDEASLKSPTTTARISDFGV